MTKSRPLKQYNRAGGLDQRERDLLPAQKTKIFKKLFDEMKEEIGGYKKTVDYIGVGQGTMVSLNQGKKISVAIARKILDAHTKLFKKG